MSQAYRILPNGLIRQISQVDGVKENLRQLLNTFKGERTYYKEIGESLNEVLYRKISPELIQKLKNSITDVIQSNLKMIDIKEVEIQRSGQYGENFYVRLLYQIKGESKYESYEMEICK